MSKETSIFPQGGFKEIEHVRPHSPKFETWHLIIVLIVFMVVLKSFAYIKDKKRHGK
jgi:hypothetical protein